MSEKKELTTTREMNKIGVETELKDVDEYIHEAIENVRLDRSRAAQLLVHIMKAIQNKQRSDEAHSELGMTAAKYLENLQKSNEQLVKITSLFKKRKDIGDVEATLEEDDKEKIYDHLQDE